MIDNRSRSVWMDVAVAPDATPLTADASADVIVIGAGIAGLSVAYALASEARSVIVLDRGPIAGGITSRTTAHLAPICDDSLSELVEMRGEDVARRFQLSQAAAVDRIAAIVGKESIDCEFRFVDGYLFLAPGDEESTLSAEISAARRLGIQVREGHGLPFAGGEEARYLCYPNQATFHPLRYLRGLCGAIQSGRGRLHAFSAVSEIVETPHGVTATLMNGAKVSAAAAVVATNSPINDRVVLHTKQAPYRTYAMAFEIAKGTLPDALYWDTEDPYHYVRLTGGDERHDILIVGGEDHKTGMADDADRRFAALLQWMRERLPTLGRERNRWSGQVLDTLDFGAHIGRNPGNTNVYVITGDSGQGITHGVVAGFLIPDLIAGRENPYADVYDPSRKPLRAAGTFVAENLTAVGNFAEYLAPGEIGSTEELSPGQGAIVREGLGKIAAYRDEDGSLHRHSAMCTHVGCHLHWNSFEHTWDCPCHGSHFSPDGVAINGPAVTGLGEVQT